MIPQYALALLAQIDFIEGSKQNEVNEFIEQILRCFSPSKSKINHPQRFPLGPYHLLLTTVSERYSETSKDTGFQTNKLLFLFHCQRSVHQPTIGGGLESECLIPNSVHGCVQHPSQISGQSRSLGTDLGGPSF